MTNSTKLVSMLVLIMGLMCIAYGQFYSSSDGVSLPRTGRSYLTSLLKQPPSPPNAESSSVSAKKQPPVINIDGPSYYQTDKLSFRKFFNKLGKRSSDYFIDRQLPPDYLTKEALINYLYSHLHKLQPRNHGNSFVFDDDVATAVTDADDFVSAEEEQNK